MSEEHKPETIVPLHHLTKQQFGTSNVTLLRAAMDGRVKMLTLRSVWNYHAIGLDARQAKRQLRTLINTYRTPVHYPPITNGPECISDRIKSHMAKSKVQASNRQKLEGVERATTAYDPDDMLRGYNHGYRCRIQCQDGLQLLLERDEECTWRSNYHWPDKKVIYNATLYSAKLDLLKTCTVSRRGAWLERLRRQWSLCFDLVSRTKAQKLLSSGLLSEDDLPETRVVYRDSDWTIVCPTSPAGVRFLSAGTLWCTKTMNWSNRYFQQGFTVAFYRGRRYAAVSGNECRNARNEDAELPLFLQTMLQRRPESSIPEINDCAITRA